MTTNHKTAHIEDPEIKALLENLNPDWDLEILRPLQGSRKNPSHSTVFEICFFDNLQNPCANMVVKIGDCESIKREFDNFSKHVLKSLPSEYKITLYEPMCKNDKAIMEIDFLNSEKYKTLIDYYKNSPIPVLKNLLDFVLKPWHQSITDIYCKSKEYMPTRLKYQEDDLFNECERLYPGFNNSSGCLIQMLKRVCTNPVFLLKNNEIDLKKSKGYFWSRKSTIHGDLNFNNILVDDADHIKLIDFEHTRKDIVFDDLARLECEIKFVCLRHHEGDDKFYKSLMDFEALLTSQLRISVDDLPDSAKEYEDIKKAAKCIEVIRKRAYEIIHQSSYEAEIAYWIELLIRTLKYVSYPSKDGINQTTDFRKKYALASALLLADNYLKESEIKIPQQPLMISIFSEENDDPIFIPSILPEYSIKLKNFVTENREFELTQVLTYLQNHRIVLISGVGGVGKTTLARAIIDSIPNVPFWFDFSKRIDASLDEVLEQLANYMNAPSIANFKIEGKKAGEDDIQKLIAELQKKEAAWLVFDNLEMLLDDTYFRDPGLDLLFTSLRDSPYQAKIIITSRILPALADGISLIDALDDEKQELKGLKTNFAVDYLVNNGFNEEDKSQLEKLASGVDGHPLALKLLIGLIKTFGVEDTLNDLSLFQRHKENIIKKTRRLFDKLAGNEKELLERISVFRQPVNKTGIEKMYTASTSKEAVEKLIDKSLLETDHKGNYWLHPLVREFAYDDLEDKNGALELIYNHYMGLPFNQDNFVEISHYLIKYREIIDDFVIDYFLSLPIDADIFFIINEIMKQNKISKSPKVFDLIDIFIASGNNQIIKSFILSYSYYFEDVYIIDRKASFQVYHKIIELYTDIDVFEAISISVSAIATAHPSESLQIWKKLININEQLTEAVVFYIPKENLKLNEYTTFLNGMWQQSTLLNFNTKQRLRNIFDNSYLSNNYIPSDDKYYLNIKEHLNNIRNLSKDESINYIENNYERINPSFILEILADLIQYDKPRVYKLIFHVIQYHAKSYRMTIFQVSEILCQSMCHEELNYLNSFFEDENNKYALIAGMQTLDLLSGKIEKEFLMEYLNPFLGHKDTTIKKIANITKNVIYEKNGSSIHIKKTNFIIRLTKACLNPKNLIPMLQTELFQTSPFVMVVWMWASKKTNDNYNMYEIYDVGESTLKSSNSIILEASLYIMGLIQAKPKIYIDLVYEFAYKRSGKQVNFGCIPQFLFMGEREPEITDKYLKEIMLDEDDELVLFVLGNLRIYKNQDRPNINEVLSYLINHKNSDISGFSDYILNGI